MAVSVSGKNFTQISSCDSASAGGTWGGSPSQDTDNYKEGSASISDVLKASGNNDWTFTPSSSVDLSGTKHLRIWLLLTAGSLINTQVNGGIQLAISDGSNTGYYYIGGRDTYPGGWFCFVVDVSRAVDSGTKPTSMNAITSITVRTNLTAAGKNVDNTWVDNLSVCDGLIIYGDDSGGYFDFEDVYAVDSNPTNGGWGIITKFGGVYYLTGVIEVGDASGSNGCKFQAKSQVVVFEARKDSAGTGSLINSSLMGFNIVDNGTGTTEFIIGDKVGGKGVQGCVIRTEESGQASKFYLDGQTDTDVDNFKLYGTSFFGGGSFKFPATAANVEVYGCSFEECLQVEPSSCDIRDSFFINTKDADAAILWNESIDIADSVFIANTTGAAIEMPSAVGTPYAYDNLTFSGNTYDVYNSSGSAISINKNNGSNPTTYEGSSVTFLGTSVTTTITVKDINTGVVIQYARVLLYASDATGDFNYQDSVSITSSGTLATVSHSGHGLSTGDWVLIEGANEQEYNGCFQITYIDTNSYSYTLPNSTTSPATGTIKSTTAMFNTETNASGQVTDTREFANDQPLVGKVRKSSASPLYKSQPIVGTVDNVNGLTLNVFLVPDE